jgi:pyrroline-5-carboxylate reductase
MITETVGFIGAGQMARALARGFVHAGLLDASQLVVADPVAAALNQFADDIPGSRRALSNLEVAEKCSLIVLAVKPQQFAPATKDLGSVASGKLVLSILAGVRLAQLDGVFMNSRLVRVMPNTPALVGQAASAYALGPNATAADGELVGKLLNSIGQAHRVEEKLLDAVTGLSGSGPAFVYVAIEALADGGVRMGLPRDLALALAAQTVKGAAEMVLSTGDHPAVLKDRVTSPAGTTIAGLQTLENAGFRGALIGAVEAATRRSTELGGGEARV